MEEGPDFEREDAPAFRTPPPPDDRLWRHPSELGRLAAARTRRRSAWPVAIASGLTGAVLTLGVLTAAGVLAQRSQPRQVVVREAVRSAVGTGGDALDITGIAAAVEPAVVRLQITGETDRVGSGVLFRNDGHLLTNAQVVDGARTVVAVLSSGRTVPAHVVGADAASDVAVVKLDGPGPFPTVVLGTVDGTWVGEPAVAIGSAVGAAPGTSVTTGVISALGRELTVRGGSVLLDMVQTDATVSPRSSGGALLDGSGNLIGITTMYVPTKGTAALGFATPVDVARAAAEDLLALGRVRVVWLGVQGSTTPEGGGVAVASVTEGGPAGLAGLRAGDTIRRVDGRPVASMSSLRLALRRRHPGERVRVVYDRSGSRHSTDVLLGEHP